LNPALAQRAACYGPMATIMSERVCIFHEHMSVMELARPVSNRMGSWLTSSKHNRGLSTMAQVMTCG
jgi:hypothetical protein